MTVQIDITGADAQGRVFLTGPGTGDARCGGTAGAVDVTLSSAGTVGGLVFDTVRRQGAASADSLAYQATVAGEVLDSGRISKAELGLWRRGGASQGQRERETC